MNRRRFIFQASGLAASAFGLSQAAFSETTKINAMPDYASTGAKLVRDSTPAADGFYYPAEWHPHEYTIMVLPPPQNWQGYGIPLDEVRDQWADVANALIEYEPVLMVVRPEDMALARRILSREIELIEIPVNDGWSRDSGPMIVLNDQGQRRIAGFTFNGWGAKFPPYSDDAMLKAHLCRHLDMPMYPIDLVLEGGAVAVDGEGTLLTTEQCLLHANRNGSGDRNQVEKMMNHSLGTTKVIWLGKGLEPDPVTDGHIDGLAAFARPGLVLLHTTTDKSDPNYTICQDAKRRLTMAKDAKGRSIEVVELPLDGDLSHMNFYIANDCVLVPITGRHREDERPMEILRDVFADREVIGIDSNILGEGGGGIHCITQQVPKGN